MNVGTLLLWGGGQEALPLQPRPEVHHHLVPSAIYISLIDFIYIYIYINKFFK